MAWFLIQRPCIEICFLCVLQAFSWLGRSSGDSGTQYRHWPWPSSAHTHHHPSNGPWQQQSVSGVRLFLCTACCFALYMMTSLQHFKLNEWSVHSVVVPSVLWRCWLGGRNGIRPVKNWVVWCWHSYLSGARCRLAYGSADATDTHLLQVSCFSKI